jgi:hypothetical protein
VVASQLSNSSDRSSVKKTEIPISYSTKNSEEPRKRTQSSQNEDFELLLPDIFEILTIASIAGQFLCLLRSFAANSGFWSNRLF